MSDQLCDNQAARTRTSANTDGRHISLELHRCPRSAPGQVCFGTKRLLPSQALEESGAPRPALRTPASGTCAAGVARLPGPFCPSDLMPVRQVAAGGQGIGMVWAQQPKLIAEQLFEVQRSAHISPRRHSDTIVSHRNRPQRVSRQASLRTAATSSAVGGSGSGRSNDGGSAIATTLTPTYPHRTARSTGARRMNRGAQDEMDLTGRGGSTGPCARGPAPASCTAACTGAAGGRSAPAARRRACRRCACRRWARCTRGGPRSRSLRGRVHRHRPHPWAPPGC